MRKAVLAAMAGAAVLVGGCTINQKAPVTLTPNMCGFVAYSLDVPIPDPGSPQPPPLSPFAQAIEGSLESYEQKALENSSDKTVESVQAIPEQQPAEYQRARMLFMSGGSQHGAYGAGILKGWQDGGGIPDLQVVTGISTGSILASFAFVGRGDFAAEGYTIDSESQLLKVYSKPKNGKPDLGNYMDLVKKGAFANLDPLRGRLEGFLTRKYTVTDADGTVRTTDVMHEITRRHAAGRRLYVGAVDVDTGNGTAFNMGDMATRYDTAQIAGDTVQAKRWLDCYVSAIVASSSTPMAAPPEFIDNTLYIDGGARFGVFGDVVVEAARKHALRADDDHLAHIRPRIYTIIDGTLQMPPPNCPKLDPAQCSGDPPSWAADGQHKDWNVLELALGSERILVNQVYRFSAGSVQAGACEGQDCFNFLRIEPDIAAFGITLPAPLNAGNEGQLTCAQWAAVDVATDNPIQFQKRYMRCLIAYGQSKVAAAGWGAGE
jgi:predicted acylesterase/phospholipase RssA